MSGFDFDQGVSLFLTALSQQLPAFVASGDGSDGSEQKEGAQDYSRRDTLRAGISEVIDQVCDQFQDVGGGGGGVSGNTTSTGLCEADAKAQATSCLHVALRKFAREFVVAGEKLVSDGDLTKTLSGVLDLVIGLAQKSKGEGKVQEKGDSSGLVDPDLPFRVLEDWFQVLSVEDCEMVWGLLEARSLVFTHEQFMPAKRNTKSKLAMLRIANFLLRRLSQSHHTVFCGRIMMFLAYAFPLSERSGVNLLGSHNGGNVTDVESKDLFEEANTKGSSSEEMSEQEQEQDTDSIDYVLYSTFWQLQKFFMNKLDRAPNGCVSSNAKWDEFVSGAGIVLGAFEAKPFVEADLVRASKLRAKQRQAARIATTTTTAAAASSSVTNNTSSGAGGPSDVVMVNNDDEKEEPVNTQSSSFYCTKYLSNSRLLHLQLADAGLRRNVLTQLMMVLDLLTHLNERCGVAPLVLKLPTGLKVDTILEAVKELEGRCLTLLRGTPADGDEFTVLVQHVLSRERNWALWKEQKCLPFERERLSTTEEEENQGEERKKKRKSDKVRKTIKDNCKLWGSGGVKDWVSACANVTPNLEFHMTEMVEAMDPANVEDEEYHPKHDEKYCWKGLRLFVRTQLDVMDSVADGSFETAVRKFTDLKKAKQQLADAKTSAAAATAATAAADTDVKKEVKEKGKDVKQEGDGTKTDVDMGEESGEGVAGQKRKRSLEEETK